MTPNFKIRLMACFVFVVCNASTASAGFFEDLFSIFNPPQNATPKTVPAEPAKSTTTQTAPQSKPVVANKPTVQVQGKKPSGKPTQTQLDEMLWLAALHGNNGRIRGLVEQGANPASGTQHGETPLHVAASRGHLKPLIYLANHGGSVNARTKNGWTPLHHAARFGHLQAVKYLLHMGAIPHIRTSDKGRKSPMEMAVDNGYIDIALLFGYRPK